ncbi:MAG: hypothetical protein ACLTDM_04280 [Clostridium butyricum]
MEKDTEIKQDIKNKEFNKEREARIEEFRAKFVAAIQSMPLDNIVTKEQNKFTKYSKEQVKRFLNNPANYENELRKVVDNLSVIYPQYDNICNYLPNAAVFNYYLIPVIENMEKVDSNKIMKEYVKATQYLKNLNIKKQFKECIKSNFKYDTFYGYEIETKDSYLIKPLNPKYCRIWGQDEDGIYLVDFDFSYFSGTREKLIYGDELGRVAYPDEFRKKYELYKKDTKLYRWQSLDNGVCTKYNNTILDYSIPPFIGLFESLVDIDNYRALARSKAETDIWKLLSMKIPINNEAEDVDDFLLSMDTIQLFNTIVQQMLPSGVGVITTPMDTTDITFNKNATADRNNVEDSINLLFDQSGYSKLLFGGANNNTALAYSVKVDEQRLFDLYRQYEAILNKKLKKAFRGRFKVAVIDMSKMTEDKVVEQLLKVAQAGVPVKTKLVAAMGVEPYEMLGLQVLENNVLECSKNWIPLQISSTQSGKEGANPKEDSELTEKGMQSRENGQE